METPKATERNIFDPKVYEFDTRPYTRIPDDNPQFDMQQYVNGFGGGRGVSDHQNHHHHAEEKNVEGRRPYMTSNQTLIFNPSLFANFMVLFYTSPSCMWILYMEFPTNRPILGIPNPRRWKNRLCQLQMPRRRPPHRRSISQEDFCCDDDGGPDCHSDSAAAADAAASPDAFSPPSAPVSVERRRPPKLNRGQDTRHRQPQFRTR